MRRRFGVWIVVGAAILVPLVGAVVPFNEPDVADTIATTPVAEREVVKPAQPSDKSVIYAPIELPSGLEIDLTLVFNYALAKWVAATPISPRDFLAGRIGFGPCSTASRDEDRPFLQALSQILTAYPQAHITIVATSPNNLGRERATSIRDALMALAADPAQLNVRGGDARKGAPQFEMKFEMGVGSDLDA